MHLLYGGPDFENRTKDVDGVRLEASAIYVLVYNRAQTRQDEEKSARCDLAWNLAGDVLLNMITKPGWWKVNPVTLIRALGGDRDRGGRETEAGASDCSASPPASASASC